MRTMYNKDTYPLRGVDFIVHSLSWARLLPKGGYWRANWKANVQDKLHFLLERGRALMSNTPFGLCDAPDTFQYLIQSACARLTLETALFRMFSKVKLLFVP